MKLVFLSDRNTLPDTFLKGESGLSFYIEEEGTKILFDTSLTGLFLENARRIGLNLFELDFVTLSNGRLNHSSGLIDLVRFYTEGLLADLNYKKPELITHPEALIPKLHPAIIESGSYLGAEFLARHFEMKITRKPFMLTDKLIYLGEIPRRHSFEEPNDDSIRIVEGKEHKDEMWEDSALVYKSSKGLVIITGSAYSGICNIIDYARLVCEEDRIIDIIGGFNLIKPGEYRLKETLRYLKHVKAVALHPTMNTDLKSKIALSTVTLIKETGTGLTLNF
ncbi:MAG: MBL fold metallo-hydrolase [Melioribacteraceae bacterium]|nr:MAG: MBL fold metallo-hydrolase [Melioribacteraceae bacterium]